MKKFFVLLVLITVSFTAYSQKAKNENKTVYLTDTKQEILDNTYSIKHGIGFAGSMMSSYGLSYQYSFSPISRMEASAFFFMNSDESENDEYNYNNTRSYGSVGVEYHHLLAARRHGKLFYMAGAGYSFYTNEDEDPYWDNNEKDRGYALGTGVIIEGYAKSMNLTFNLDIGVAYRRTLEDVGSDSEGVRKYFGIAIGAGIYYNF